MPMAQQVFYDDELIEEGIMISVELITQTERSILVQTVTRRIERLLLDAPRSRNRKGGTIRTVIIQDNKFVIEAIKTIDQLSEVTIEGKSVSIMSISIIKEL
jgi:hypothetical protein